jgi:hypothetical protein
MGRCVYLGDRALVAAATSASGLEFSAAAAGYGSAVKLHAAARAVERGENPRGKVGWASGLDEPDELVQVDPAIGTTPGMRFLRGL